MLFRSKTGSVKILDMGLARSVANPNDALTGKLNEEVISGTADFLSPEQALNCHLDTRTDIYSLGATFYTLLTGCPPYEGGTGQKLAQHQMAPPPDVRAVRPEVPAEMAAVIARMMAKRPVERYQTARDVRAALAPWVPGADLAPGTATAEHQLLVSRPRHRGRRAAVVGLGVLLLAAVAVALLHKPKPTTPSQPTAPEAAPAAQTAPSTPIRRFVGHTAAVNDVVISPDETRLASVDWAGKVLIWDLRTGQRLHELTTRPGARGLCCTSTPDGQFLLVSGERMPILVFEWATGRAVHEYPGHDNTTWGLAVSPDGGHLLSCGHDGTVVLRALPGGEEVRRFEFAARMVWAVAFSPDGKKMAASSGAATSAEESYLIKVWATADGTELNRLTGHTWDVRTIAFRPDGGALLSGSFDGSVRLWDLTKGGESRPIGDHDGVVERVYFLPGGRHLLTCGGPMQGELPSGEGAAVKVWEIPSSFVEGTSPVKSDGVAETARELKCWRGDGWADLLCLAPARGGVLAAAGARDRSLRVWSLADSPAASVAKLVHAFELSKGTAFRSRFERRAHSDPAALALAERGVYLHCWKEESVAEFRGERGAGRPWIGVTNLNDDLSSQMIFQCDEKLTVPLVAGRQYRVRIEYRCTGEAEGRAQVRNPKGDDFSPIVETQLGRTGSGWKIAEMTFRRPPDGKIDVCVMNTAVGEGNVLAVRAVEVFEVDAER